ncbi:D-alanine--poly(phosphoribitol) ligase subunit 1 [hydrothermal vent metagenome]|uniref:D-alanine--poly(Phosphoribitol) ligase subunit 1 n=1 Tax=hydrothermal vent metagenome TaxID=652676 RepID=A0A1W1E423_9ZZZZ
MFYCFNKRTFLSLEKEGDKLAVAGSDIEVSWFELKQKVDCQVSKLRQQTNGLTIPIVLYGHKEVDFVVLILACLTLKIPFIPIDVSYPKKRIDNIKQQLGKGILIEVASGLITPFGNGKVLCQQDDNDPLAYIIFTSGSTGEPKGVQINASNLNSFIAWLQLSLPLSNHQVFMNQALLSFDLSVFEWVNALRLGASLVLMDSETALNPTLFKQRFLHYGCSVWSSTPSFALAFAYDSNFNRDNFPLFEAMFLCGEVLTTKSADLLLCHFPNLKLFNTYGPTEATVMMSSIQITRKIVDTYPHLPIGNASNNYNIDSKNSGTFEAHTTGELLITGDNVSIGYLNANNDDFTTNKAGVRCYATGDRVYQQDDKLFFAGRSDSMIKYNGHRIDLGEINYLIGQLAGISNVRTLPLERGGRIIRLISFIQTTEVDADAISTHLELRLPKYMIPSEYIFHTVFPLTLNLKVDNKQLLKQYLDF